MGGSDDEELGGFCVPREDNAVLVSRPEGVTHTGDLPPIFPHSSPSTWQPPPAAIPRAVSGGCERCNSLSFDPNFLTAFGIPLCAACKAADNLVTKTNAHQLFCLTPNDLKALGSISKPNPRNPNWGNMRLFLQSQVEHLAHKKYGGPSGLQEHREELVANRIEGAKKRKADTSKAEREDAAAAKVRERIDRDIAAAQQAHKDSRGEDGGLQRTFGRAGVAVDLEQI